MKLYNDEYTHRVRLRTKSYAEACAIAQRVIQLAKECELPVDKTDIAYEDITPPTTYVTHDDMRWFNWVLYLSAPRNTDMSKAHWHNRAAQTETRLLAELGRHPGFHPQNLTLKK